MLVPKRRVSPVHVSFETRARTVQERRGRGRGRSSTSVCRRPAPRRFVIAHRPPVVVVVDSVAAATKATSVVPAIAAGVSAIRAATSAAVVVVIVAEVVVVAAAAVAAVVAVVATATTVPGAQSAADEREQLLHVPVELVGQASDAGTVDFGHCFGRVVPQIRFEVYSLGVPLRSLLLLLLLRFLRAARVRGVFGRRRFRSVRFDHFHRQTVPRSWIRPSVLLRRNAAVHARRRSFGSRPPPSTGAPQTTTTWRRRHVRPVHFRRSAERVASAAPDGRAPTVGAD